jgi:membrane protease YdiL (CAAX protease family)
MDPAPITASLSPQRRAAGPLRRWLEGVLFVAVWMGIGFAMPADTNAYLLLGVPLTLLFQLGIRRAPVRALWVREAPPFRLGWAGWIAAVGLAILPALLLCQSLMKREWSTGGWFFCAMAGAVAAGYSLHYFSRAVIRPFLLCLATAGVLGAAIFVFFALYEGGRLRFDPGAALSSLLLYFPVIFVLEEVSFRGALDTHVYRPGDRFPWPSALAVSALWGLWHLPTLPVEQRGVAMAGMLVVVHSLVGVPLSLYWRKSGNLLVPGFAHALVDAIRNAIQAAS